MRTPFDELEVPAAPAPLTAELRARWVTPFYLALSDDLLALEPAVRAVLQELRPEVIEALLLEPNWRPRVAGSLFVALNQLGDFDRLVGRLLLRSDGPYAGRGYCLALARLNTPGALDVLREYLGYYLTRRDLALDQATAMAALGHLDNANGTRYSLELEGRWSDFVQDKPHWDLAKTRARFDVTMRDLATLRARCA